jgi:hypothetical protein
MKTSKAVVTGLTVLVIGVAVGVWTAAVGVSPTIYVVRDREEYTQLLWNEHDAYLFIGIGHSGWSGSPIRFAWELLRNMAGLSSPSDRRKHDMMIIHIAENNVNTQVISDAQPSVYYVFENRIYGVFRGELSVLTGQAFKPVPDGERQQLEARSHAFGVYDNVAGWSNRLNLLGRPAGTHSVHITDDVALVALIERAGAVRKRLALQGPNIAARALFEITEESRSVSRDEYESIFE